MTTIVRADSPASFLSLVPRIAGFQPRNSLVFVVFHGNRTMGVARYDHPDSVESLRTMMGSLVAFTEADAVVPILYSDVQPMLTSPLVTRFATLMAITQGMGYRMPDLLVVGPSEFYSLLELGDPVRYPVSDITEAGRQHAALNDTLGEAPTGSHTDLDPLNYTPEQIDRLRHAIRSYEGKEELVAELVPLSTEAVIEGTGGLHDLARMAVALRTVGYRDLLFEWFLTGVCPDPDAYDHRLVVGDVDVDVDPERLRRGAQAMRAIAAASDEGFDAGQALSVAAWFTWALGKASAADQLLAAALEEDADNTFAPLFRTVMSTGIIPRWAVRAGDEAARKLAAE